MSQFTLEQLAAGPKYKGRLTHFTMKEGGIWHDVDIGPLDHDWIMDRAFAFKYESGDIWDPIAGWRRD